MSTKTTYKINNKRLDNDLEEDKLYEELCRNDRTKVVFHCF